MGTAIAKATAALHTFVREVRESRAELEALGTNLHSLDATLDFMATDASTFPPAVAKETPRVLEQATAIVNELEAYISILNDPSISRADKRGRWIATRRHLTKLEDALATYKEALALGLDLVQLYVASCKSRITMLPCAY